MHVSVQTNLSNINKMSDIYNKHNMFSKYKCKFDQNSLGRFKREGTSYNVCICILKICFNLVLKKVN